MLLQYYFLAINPASGGVKTQEQSKHNFWSKMMKVTVPAKEEKTDPILEAVYSLHTPTGKTQHNPTANLHIFIIINFIVKCFIINLCIIIGS